MMSICGSKHVEAWNKYIKKECVSLVINQNYVKMHGQQNIKKVVFLHTECRPAAYTVTFRGNSLAAVSASYLPGPSTLVRTLYSTDL
jgi:hypothetical protein